MCKGNCRFDHRAAFTFAGGQDAQRAVQLVKALLHVAQSHSDICCLRVTVKTNAVIRDTQRGPAPVPTQVDGN